MPSERDKTRRWLQFRIRELLIGILAFALALGWWMDREQLRREVEIKKVQVKQVEIQKVQLKQVAEAQLLWEVKYKNFRIMVDDVLQLEHYGQPLENLRPDELVALKKEIDGRYATVSDDEPTAAQIKQRIDFFRRLHELKDGETIDPPAMINGGFGSGRAAKTRP